MQTLENISIPVLSFRSSGVLHYNVSANHRTKILNNNNFLKNAALLTKRERYKGYVSEGAKKRMKKAITLLLQSTPYTYKVHPVSGRVFHHKVSFITLTTPADQKSLDAKFCHKNLLEPFLRRMRDSFSMKSYIWKCELQANGQVHYHITADIVINHTALRNIWNNLLRKNDMLKAFKAQYGHDDPNSTDIHNVYKVNNLEAYLVKYICKAIGDEAKLNAKVWDCSKNLKAADYFKLELDFKTHQAIRYLQTTQQVITKYFDKAIFLDFKTNDYYSFFSENIVNNFYEHLKNIRSWQTHLNGVSKTLKTKSVQLSNFLHKEREKWIPQQLQLMYRCCII